MKRRPRHKSLSLTAQLAFWDRPVSSLVFVLMACGLLALSAVNPAIFDDARAGAYNSFGSALAVISTPVQGASEFVRGVTGLADMQQKIATLEQENARLREWYQTALVLEEQNLALRDLLNVKIEPNYAYVTGRVVSDAGNAFVKSLLVRVGSADGIESGNPVISGDGLVGRVVNTGRNFSRVLLLNDMNSRIPVLVEALNQHAVLAGQNGTTPVLEHMARDIELKDGMRVVTSGIGGYFPAGLPVGVVERSENGSPRVILFSDVQKIQFVRVLQTHEDPNLVRGIVE